MLALKFHLTEEEYFDYNYYTTWAAPIQRAYRIRYYLRVFLPYTFIACLFIFSNSSGRILIDFLIFGLIASIYFLFVPFLIKRSIRARVKDILSKPGNQHVLGESEVVLMDTGILDKDAVSETRYDWEAIVRKTETSKYYYLYTNSYHAVVIPKRTISSERDKKELQRLFDTYLPLHSEYPSE